jgi:hypothetical protein
MWFVLFESSGDSRVDSNLQARIYGAYWRRAFGKPLDAYLKGSPVDAAREGAYMKGLRSVVASFSLALMGMVFAPSANADTWNKKTIVTFSAPVQTPGVHQPGYEVLPAGTYVFKIMNTAGNRHIVQIFNEDETKVLATVLTIPNARLKPADQTTLNFRETPAGEAPAMRAWFYPGEQWGHEFVYPKKKAAELAKASGEPVLEAQMPAEAPKPEASAVVSELEREPVKAVEPSGKEVAEAVVVTPPPAEKVEVAQAELPKTASPLPLIALLGLLALGGAAGLHVAERRVR